MGMEVQKSQARSMEFRTTYVDKNIQPTVVSLVNGVSCDDITLASSWRWGHSGYRTWLDSCEQIPCVGWSLIPTLSGNNGKCSAVEELYVLGFVVKPDVNVGVGTNVASKAIFCTWTKVVCNFRLMLDLTWREHMLQESHVCPCIEGYARRQDSSQTYCSSNCTWISSLAVSLETES
jgi:hypothetical protein